MEMENRIVRADDTTPISVTFFASRLVSVFFFRREMPDILKHDELKRQDDEMAVKAK